MKDDKISQLTRKTIDLLEKTKKQYKMYEKERQELYRYFVNESDLEKWEAYINKFEEIINGKL